MVIDANLTSHENLKSSNFECFIYIYIYIYISELQEEAPMDKEHQKRENKELIYTASFRKFKKEKLS
jgi:hypothetical protein